MTVALVMGAGSIGSRHARVLGELGAEVVVVSSRSDLALPTFADVETAFSEREPDYVVVATETARHAASVAALHAVGYRGRLLIEKPLAVPEPDLTGFSGVGVGFNLRFHPVIQRLHAVLSAAAVHTVEVYAGQHLSDWRPDRPLGEQYSTSRARGGGVLRDLSHEFDYLAMILGPCTGVFGIGGRVADLTEDSDDAWAIVARYERAPVVSVQLNYLDTGGRRRIVANTSVGTVVADVVAGTLTVAGTTERFESDRDDTYRALHRAMLESSGAVASVADAAAVDRVIDQVERSAATGRWLDVA